MKIKEQTRKLAAEVAQNTVLRLWIELTKSVTVLRQDKADVV